MPGMISGDRVEKISRAAVEKIKREGGEEAERIPFTPPGMLLRLFKVMCPVTIATKD